MAPSGKDVVTLTVVASEAEASMICGYLGAQGIHAAYDRGSTPGLATFASSPSLGRQEILVAAADLEAAREALAALAREQ